MKRNIWLFLVLQCFLMGLGYDVYANDSMDSLSVDNHFFKVDGDSAYARNDYNQAIVVYENILQGGEAAEVYYNLGNAYYKQGNLAKAILNYERALLLEPGSIDTRANLDIARAKTVDKVDVIPDIFFVAWMKILVNKMGIVSWSVLGIVCFIGVLLMLGLFFLGKQYRLKKISFICTIVLFFISVFSNIVANYQRNNILDRNYAIVMTPSVTIRSTPDESGTSLFILHEGHKVQIKDKTMKSWTEIRLTDGKVGWIKTSEIEII